MGVWVPYVLYILEYIKFIHLLTCLQRIQHKVQIYTILMMVKKWYKIHAFVSRWFKFLAIIKFDKFNIYYKKIYSLLPNISLVNANLVFYMIFIFFCRDEAKPKFGGIFVGYADKECQPASQQPQRDLLDLQQERLTQHIPNQ